MILTGPLGKTVKTDKGIQHRCNLIQFSFFSSIVWRLPVADMKIEKNKILVGKEKPKLTINSPVITFSLQPPPNTLLENPLQLAFRRLKVSL